MTIISAHKLKERATTMFGDCTKELEESLAGFLFEGKGIETTLKSWLKKEEASLERAHRGATEYACQGMINSFRAVADFVEVMRDCKNHDQDSLESSVDRFQEAEWERKKRYEKIKQDEGDSVSTRESIGALLEVVGTTNGLVKRSLAAKVVREAAASWFTQYDLSAITEDVDFHLNLLEENFLFLKMLVIELLDPKYESLLPNLKEIERNVQELKAKMSIKHG